MIGYLINPYKKTITEVNVKDNNDIGKLISSYFSTQYNEIDASNDIWFDDEMELDWELPFFMIDSKIARYYGKGLILGSDDENLESSTLSIHEVKDMITFYEIVSTKLS